jgi:O-antigen/teichoic acid export membrane protein
MSKLNLLLKGSFAQVAESIIAIVIGFITLPLMQKSLGGDLYGVWILIGGFTAILYIFDLGFASSIIQSVAKSVATKNVERTNAIINSALLVYAGISTFIMLLVAAVIFLYKPAATTVISHSDLQWIVLIVGLSIAIEFPFKAFAGLSQAYLRFDKAAMYRIIVKLVSFIAMVLLLHYGFKLIAIALLGLVSGIVSNYFFLRLARNVFSELKISSSLISKKLIKELFSYSSWSLLIDMNSILKGRIDIFFIGGYVSLNAVSIYYVPVRLVEYAMQLSFRALNLGMPILAGNAAGKDEVKFYENFVLYNRVNIYFSIAIFVFFLVFGQAIIYHWMGKYFDSISAYYILIILLAGRISSLANNGFSTALYAKALHKQLAYNALGETFCTAVLLYLALVEFELGVIWAAASVSIPLFISRFFILPYMSFRVLKTTGTLRLLLLSYRPLAILFMFLPMFFLFLPGLTFGWHHAYLALFFIVLFVGFSFFDIQKNEKMMLFTLKQSVLKRFRG